MEQRNGRIDRHGQRASEVATLYYLGAELEARSVVSRMFHGSMTFEARQQSHELFAREGGVLVATITDPT